MPIPSTTEATLVVTPERLALPTPVNVTLPQAESPTLRQWLRRLVG